MSPDLVFRFGENLCQIRACQLLEIYEKELRPYKLVNFKFYAEKRKVKLAIRKVNELISGEYEADFLAAGGTLLEYLEKNQLNILLSKSTFFLTLSHFLSILLYQCPFSRRFAEFNNTTIDRSCPLPRPRWKLFLLN